MINLISPDLILSELQCAVIDRSHGKFVTLALQRTTQFSTTATNHSTVISDEIRSVEIRFMRSDEVR